MRWLKLAVANNEVTILLKPDQLSGIIWDIVTIFFKAGNGGKANIQRAYIWKK